MSEVTAFISATTMGGFSPSKGKPEPTIKRWKSEINSLMKDFNIPKPQRNSIIHETEKESRPGDRSEILYERAWRKFWAIL